MPSIVKTANKSALETNHLIKEELQGNLQTHLGGTVCQTGVEKLTIARDLDNYLECFSILVLREP